MTKEDHHDHAHHGDGKGKGGHLSEDSSTESKGHRDRSHDRDRRHHQEETRRRKREREQGLSIRNQDDSDDDSSRHVKRSRKHHRSTHKKRRRGEDHNHHDDHSSKSDDFSSDERHRHKSSHRKRESDQRKRKDKKSHHSKSDKKDKKSKKTKKERHKSSRDADELKHGEHRGKATTSSRNQSTRHQHDKKALYSMGEPLGQPPLTLINPEMDYFTYHQEFWVYLYREEGVRFNDLTSEEAREAFQRFAEQYNDGKLEGPYYDNPPTFPAEVLDECKTTDHKWGFQTTEAERRGLEQLQEGVRRLTQYQDGKEQEAIGTKKGPSTTGVVANRTRESDGAVPSHPRQKTSEEWLDERRGNRRLRDHVQTTHEELMGGPKDFRERQIEKKKQQAERVHGASRDKEEGLGVELNDDAVYGDGDVSFQQALARERQAQARREQKRQARLEDLQKKERERQENMLKVLGLDSVQPGQKISIPPREDH